MKLALLLVAACSASHAQVPLADVYVFGGDTAPYPGAQLLAHDASGTPIDGADADALGHGAVQAVTGGTVTAVMPGEPTTLATTITLITVPAPDGGGEVDIHGPPAPTSPAAAGVLLVQPPAFTADAFTIELGCTITSVTSFPASIDVSTLCVTADANLDVLVLARTSGQIVGYAAGRVPLVDGFAMFQPAAWTTTITGVPIANATAAQLAWQLRADGLPFATQAVTTSAPYYTGLAAGAATLVATNDTQVTTRQLSGMPASIAIAASDFLPAVAQTITFDGARLYAWSAADSGADALDLELDWTAPTAHIVWDIILPPDATGVTLPGLGGDLATLVGTPTGSSLLQYVAATPAVGFDALVAAGYYAGTVGPLPADGEIRTVRIPGP